MQFADHGRQQVLRFEFFELRDLCDGVEPGLWSLQMGDRDGAIERDDRRGFEPVQLVVMREDQIELRRFNNWSVGFLPASRDLATDDAAVQFLRGLTSRI